MKYINSLQSDTMRRVAIYMRVSTARQEEDQTVQNQFMELRERVAKDGNLLLPDCIYKDEGWSGAILERPDLDRMRSDARGAKFEILYTYDRGRLSRKFVHQEVILDELRECHVEYISLHDVNGTSSEDQLMGGVMGIFHEYERTKITERMRLGKMRKVKESKKLLGYNPKYGYDYHPKVKAGATPSDGYFTINSKESGVVSQIFQWIADGHTKREVRKMLYENGITPPKGRREMWSSGTLDRLLKDTTYFGDHYYNKSESVPTKNPQNPDIKYRKVIKGSRKVRPREEWLLIQVPPIIDRPLFDKVQIQLNVNKRLNPRNNNKNDYLVKGLVRCLCGKARTGDPGGNGHTYYRCTDRLSRYPLPRECFESSINAKVLDASVWKQIVELLTQPDLIRQQAKRWHSKASPLIKRIDALNATMTGLDDEEKRYTKAYGTGLMSERLYREQAQIANDKRIKLQQELNNVEAELADRPKLTVEQIVAGTKETLRSLDLTDKTAIIKKTVHKIIATKKEVTIWGHIPILVSGQVGLHAEHRHSRTSECWEVDVV